ncbi:hypothetical protein Golob_011249, partial [Gossypium lobatum]|nr:hypothetical protein [Gossypium lobatum]
GVLTLEFDDGEVFKWSKVTTSIYNLILGKLYCDHYGTMRIEGNRDYSCKLKFKEQSIIDRNPHQVHGGVQDRNGKTVATLFGKWDESMHYANGDCSAKGKGQDSLAETHLLWKRSKPPKYSTRYNLTRFAITLNELTPGLKEKLPPTDSRLRPDQRYLENGEYEMANSEKLRLEQRQRQIILLDLANSFEGCFMSNWGFCFQIKFRLGTCKREVGSQGGLQRIKTVIHIDLLVDIGRLESKGNGIHVLIFLAKSLLIIPLT